MSDKGLRYNSNKNKLELIPPEWEWALGMVTTKGSEKYAPRNWEKGMDHSIMIGCMKRHIAKYLAGQKYDMGETGCHHLAMVAWNALALMSYDLRNLGNNDIPVSSLAVLENTCVEEIDKELNYRRDDIGL